MLELLLIQKKTQKKNQAKEKTFERFIQAMKKAGAVA